MLGPMLSPIQQLENFEESEIQLDPQELLPIMEVGLLMYFFKSGGSGASLFVHVTVIE